MDTCRLKLPGAKSAGHKKNLSGQDALFAAEITHHRGIHPQTLQDEIDSFPKINSLRNSRRC